MAGMKWLRFAIVAYVVTLLQTAFIPIVFPAAIRPNVMVIAAGYYLLVVPRADSLVAALIIGALGDLTSICPLGSQIIGFAVFAAVVRFVRPMLFTEQPTAHAFTAAVGYLILNLFYRLVTLVAHDAMPLPYGFAVTVMQAASTAVFAAVVCKLAIRRPRVSRGM
jgi:rod shape-determining protein MreD